MWPRVRSRNVVPPKRGGCGKKRPRSCATATSLPWTKTDRRRRAADFHLRNRFSSGVCPVCHHVKLPEGATKEGPDLPLEETVLLPRLVNMNHTHCHCVTCEIYAVNGRGVAGTIRIHYTRGSRRLSSGEKLRRTTEKMDHVPNFTFCCCC